MKKSLLLLLCILLFSVVGKSQELNSSNKMSIEVGFGYSTLSWKVESLAGNLQNDRNQFWVLPSFKMKFFIPLTAIDQPSVFQIAPFAGYNMSGGKSKTELNGYKDFFRFQSLEIGALPTFSLKDKLQFYGGVKGQYIFSAKNKAFGSALSQGNDGREWSTNDVDKFIKDFSFSIGAGMNYSINRFFLGIETWLGVTDLSEFQSMSIYENNYRLIFGYKIK